MTGTQLYLAIGLLCLVVVASLTISLFQMSGVRVAIREIRSELSTIAATLAALDVQLGRLKSS